MSPTILRQGSYRVVIYTHDHPPAHVHVISAGRFAKFSLDPVILLDHEGYHGRDIRTIERMIIDNRSLLLDAWNEIHGEPEA